jgi:membrane peptidoglycan carboxypeptidase
MSEELNELKVSAKEKYEIYKERKAERKRKAAEKEKQRQIRKQSKYLLFKVKAKKGEWHPIAYYPALFFAAMIECYRLLFKFVCFLLFSVLVLGFCGGLLFMVLAKPTYDNYSNFAKEKVNESSYDTFRIAESSIIYDKNNKVLANLHETADTEYLDYDEIPQDVIDAFVAIEDRTFWTNAGIDVKGIIRVLYNAIKSEGDEMHGASTITQQLARNIFLTHEVSIERKGKEMLISLYLTDKYTKKDIMEFYCNDICFANGIYGIQGASKAYFGKSVDQLSLKQIAYLCAIPNRPEYYNPYTDKTRALERCHKILNDMYECGYITEDEFAKADNETIIIQPQKFEFNDYESSYAIDCAIRYLMELNEFEFRYTFEDMDDYDAYRTVYNTAYEAMRHKLYTGGYKIYTSIDLDVYEQLQAILDKKLAFSKDTDEETGLFKLQGALTCIDNETGKVIAVVGGRSQVEESNETEETTTEDEESTEDKEETSTVTNGVYTLNRAFQSYRQPGSTFKPLAVYTPALQRNFTPSTMVENIDVTKAKEKGVDVQSLHGNQLTLRSAVEKSLNGVAWKIFDKITPEYGLSFINEMQFAKICPNDYFNASALGGLTYGATTVEMAGGYNALANHGVWTEPTCIRYILARDGVRYTPDNTKTVYKAKAADDMVDILKGVLIRGTASGLGWSRSTKMDAFGKTGTTNNCKDGWFCGATPYYTISVWVGYDIPETLPNLYGATYPGQIWKDAMLTVIDGLEPKQFERDTEDESYTEIIPELEATGYYSYLAGRDDSEVLSDGYTVANYREDRVIGESVYEVINKINALDKNDPNTATKLEQLYSEGCDIINQIYSRKYTAEMQGYLDAAYNSKK